MANDFLAITRTNRPQAGSNTVTLANQLVDLCDNIEALNNVAQHMTDGVTHATIEAQFGLTAGQGANFLTLLGLLNTILNTNTDVTGANRFAQLREFEARLAGQ